MKIGSLSGQVASQFRCDARKVGPREDQGIAAKKGETEPGCARTAAYDCQRAANRVPKYHCESACQRLEDTLHARAGARQSIADVEKEVPEFQGST